MDTVKGEKVKKQTKCDGGFIMGRQHTERQRVGG